MRSFAHLRPSRLALVAGLAAFALPVAALAQPGQDHANGQRSAPPVRSAPPAAHSTPAPQMRVAPPMAAPPAAHWQGGQWQGGQAQAAQLRAAPPAPAYQQNRAQWAAQRSAQSYRGQAYQAQTYQAQPQRMAPPPTAQRADRRGDSGWGGQYRGQNPARGQAFQSEGRWNRNWRHDGRYDWDGWRGEHREIFHLGRYYAPYDGWYYSPVEIGFTLDAGYYGQDYWIDDATTYHLPPAYPPYQWVRYYNDALLVDVYTGQVVDVIHDFFW